MEHPLQLARPGEDAVELRTAAGLLLLRYVVRPSTPQKESTRPYAHPVQTLAGECLTNFRPNDHPWHHGLNLTLGSVSGVNFWGGPTYRAADGYQWRDDHGTQVHVEWQECSAARLAHSLEWRRGQGALLREQRTLSPKVISPQAWQLRWQSELTNVSGHALTLGNYQSAQGLKGSHYTGLQFRGSRDLLDRHGDSKVGAFSDRGGEGEAGINGEAAQWVEWRGQKDTTLRRVRIRFENNGVALHWFIREGNPLLSFPFQFDRDHVLAHGAVLRLDHTLTFHDE
jgi:hypothetical protein